MLVSGETTGKCKIYVVYKVGSLTFIFHGLLLLSKLSDGVITTMKATTPSTRQKRHMRGTERKLDVNMSKPINNSYDISESSYNSDSIQVYPPQTCMFLYLITYFLQLYVFKVYFTPTWLNTEPLLISFYKVAYKNNLK